MKDLLTRREAARLAGVSYNGVRGWERQGRVHPVRHFIGGVETVLIPRGDIEAMRRERGNYSGNTDNVVEALRAQIETQRRWIDQLLNLLEGAK